MPDFQVNAVGWLVDWYGRANLDDAGSSVSSRASMATAY